MTLPRSIGLMLVVVATPGSAAAWDLDLDGHIENDEHPCAADRSGRMVLPADDDFGTLMLESDGDDDFNDAVLGYQFVADVNDSLEVAAVTLRAVARALGDEADVGLGWWLRVGTDAPVEVTIDAGGQTETRFTMTSTTIITIDVFTSLRGSLGGGAGPLRTGPESNIEPTEIPRHSVSVSFSAPVRIDFEQMHEGLHFREMGLPVAPQMKTPSGLPRVLTLPSTSSYPREGVSIFVAWPRLASLIRTKNRSDLDFYRGPHDPDLVWGEDQPSDFEDQPRIDVSCISQCGTGEAGCNAAFAAQQIEDCGTLVDDAFEADALGAPARGSNDYLAPAMSQVEHMPVALQALAEGAAVPAVQQADAAGYRLCRNETADVLVFVPYTAGEGRAVFAWRVQGTRPVVVGAPHPHFETNTRDEARRLFAELGLRVLVMAGTHRCGSDTDSQCSGTTSVCGNAGDPFRISDMAHTTDSIYQVVHQSFAQIFPNDVQLSLHGMSGDGVSISNGSNQALAHDGTAARLARAMGQVLNGERITVCQSSAEFTVEERLCGRTNAQGRALNGSADACSTPATQSSGRFVHVEQSLAVRQQLDLVVSAFDAALPN